MTEIIEEASFENNFDVLDALDPSGLKGEELLCGRYGNGNDPNVASFDPNVASFKVRRT